MRHLWTAVGILCGLILLLEVNTACLNRLTLPLASSVRLASTAAREGDWETAMARSEAAEAAWDACETYLYLVQHHSRVSEIAVLLDESLERLESRDLGEYTATNARILSQLTAICRSEALSAENLF